MLWRGCLHQQCTTCATFIQRCFPYWQFQVSTNTWPIRYPVKNFNENSSMTFWVICWLANKVEQFHNHLCRSKHNKHKTFLLCVLQLNRRYFALTYWYHSEDEAGGSFPRLETVLFNPSVLRHCWLGDRKGIWPVKCPFQLSPNFLFQETWPNLDRTKTESARVSNDDHLTDKMDNN